MDSKSARLLEWWGRRGEVLEWLNRHAWKACSLGNGARGFESHPLRHNQAQAQPPFKSLMGEGELHSPTPKWQRRLYRPRDATRPLRGHHKFEFDLRMLGPPVRQPPADCDRDFAPVNVPRDTGRRGASVATPRAAWDGGPFPRTCATFRLLSQAALLWPHHALHPPGA